MNDQISGYQLFAAKTIHFMLSDPHFRENYRKVGYRNIFSDLIRQYPEINTNGEKTWTKIPLYKKYHRFTERAAKLLEEGNYKSWKDFKYEHITPVKVILEDLMALGEDPAMDDVVKALSQSEVIILTKEEAEALDGCVSQQYHLDEEMVYGAGLRSSGRTEQRLEAIGAKLNEEYTTNSVYRIENEPPIQQMPAQHIAIETEAESSIETKPSFMNAKPKFPSDIRDRIKEKMKRFSHKPHKGDFKLLDPLDKLYLQMLLDNVPDDLALGLRIPIVVKSISHEYAADPAANKRMARIQGVEVCPKEIQRYYTLTYPGRDKPIMRLESSLRGTRSKHYVN